MKFNSRRIKSARILKLLSLKEVSEMLNKVGEEVSEQTINQIEKGKILPSVNLLVSLMGIYKREIEYFFEDSFEEGGCKVWGEFLPKVQEYYRFLAEDVFERYAEYIRYKDRVSPRINSNEALDEILDYEDDYDDFQFTLDDYRERHGIEKEVLKSVVRFVETKGIYVVEVDSGLKEFDAISATVENTKAIIVKKGLSVYDKRFAVMREFFKGRISFSDRTQGVKKERILRQITAYFIIGDERLQGIFSYLFIKTVKDKLSTNEKLSNIEKKYGIGREYLLQLANDVNYRSRITKREELQKAETLNNDVFEEEISEVIFSEVLEGCKTGRISFTDGCKITGLNPNEFFENLKK